jgi:shikimate kinase
VRDAPDARPPGRRLEHPFRRILLVGFMGSGKSTVGALLAEALGWRFVDLDRVVEERAGRTIPELFREDGEAAFRDLEARVTADLLEEEEVVLAAGGGWPCREGRLESAGTETLTVWLRVSPESAGQRAAKEPGSRPLLDVPRPLERIRALLQEREAFYRKAAWWVETGNRPPSEVVRLVMDRLATHPERPLRA